MLWVPEPIFGDFHRCMSVDVSRPHTQGYSPLRPCPLALVLRSSPSLLKKKKKKKCVTNNPSHFGHTPITQLCDE
jgi:hypothetical protein